MDTVDGTVRKTRDVNVVDSVRVTSATWPKPFNRILSDTERSSVPNLVCSGYFILSLT